MKVAVGVFAAILGLGALALYVRNGSATAGVIRTGLEDVRKLFAGVQSQSGVAWLFYFAGTWLVLIFVADAGAEELAVVFAGVLFAAVLYAQIANGQLQANLQALGGQNA